MPVQIISPVKFLVETSDHWNIALYEYRGKVTRKYPVLLVHGISSDHHIWDPGVPGFNMAHYLVEQGYHVFSIDLRGRSGSDGPHTGRGNNWSVDDYLLCDLPAAVEAILERTGSGKIHWVGHSLGGIVGFFYQIRHKTDNLQSLTTLGTALTYTYSTINHFRSYLDYITVLQNFPIRRWWRLAGPFADMDTPWNRFLWHPDNMTSEVKRAVLEKMVHGIGVFEWNQIKTISSAEGMPRMTGDSYHKVNDRRIQVPVLMIAGDRDWICPLDGLEWTDKELRCPHKLMVFGKIYGNRTHYGHIDIVCGREAPKEVWPVVSGWLAERDSL